MMTDLVNFLNENISMVIALMALALLFFYRRPKVFLTLFLFILIIGMTFNLILNISGSAVALKQDMIRQPPTSLF